MESSGDKILCIGCVHPDKPAWVQQTINAISPAGVANRRTIAQAEGKKWAQALKAPTAEKPGDGFMAIQARERWSRSEDNHFRPGHFWLAQAGGVLDVEMERVNQRCTVEEGVLCNPGDYLVRIGRYFDRDASDASGLTFEDWVPPDGAESFLVNATELRGVNFSMTPVDTRSRRPLQEVRRSGRGARVGLVSAPSVALPKRYVMDRVIDDEIRSRCW
jgi:hypothetical protein